MEYPLRIDSRNAMENQNDGEDQDSEKENQDREILETRCKKERQSLSVLICFGQLKFGYRKCHFVEL